MKKLSAYDITTKNKRSPGHWAMAGPEMTSHLGSGRPQIHQIRINMPCEGMENIFYRQYRKLESAHIVI